ncbi:hypothetical protein [Rhodococcus sp. BS-15]|uniref:hypothetical protein n=1 Tax=Rhodococcus sp. BS-15 TaxID=1304954 RepID=UPI000B24A750|nr:hypothetical protein [Rhodococcus sp. BS-15]
MTPPPASSGDGASIDEILDANAEGLLYFERFLPLAGRVPGVDVPQYQDVCARYDEQRGLNLGALGDDADAVGAVSAVLADQLEEQIQLRRVLQLRWHGDAGEAVQTYLSAEQEKASQFLASIEDSHQTMCAAVDVLRDAVTDKAELVGGIDIDLVDGKDVDQIDAILVASGVECLPVDRESVFPRLASAFEDLKDRRAAAMSPTSSLPRWPNAAGAGSTPSSFRGCKVRARRSSEHVEPRTPLSEAVWHWWWTFWAVSTSHRSTNSTTAVGR